MGWRSQGNGKFHRWVVAIGGEVQRGKKRLHGHSGLYPRDEERVADEDAWARSSKQAAVWPGAWRHGTQLTPGGLQCIPPS